MWPSADVEIPVEVKGFGAVHLDQSVPRALIVLVAVVFMRMIIPVDFERILVRQCDAIRFACRGHIAD